MVGESAVRENNKPLEERIRLVTLKGQKATVLYMVFIAPDPDFSGLRPVFDRIMRSFLVRQRVSGSFFAVYCESGSEFGR